MVTASAIASGYSAGPVGKELAHDLIGDSLGVDLQSPPLIDCGSVLYEGVGHSNAVDLRIPHARLRQGFDDRFWQRNRIWIDIYRVFGAAESKFTSITRVNSPPPAIQHHNVEAVATKQVNQIRFN